MAGYGFSTIGDIMFGHGYVEQSGDMLGFKLVNGFVPSRGLGVVVTANAHYTTNRWSVGIGLARIKWMRWYLLGLFLDVPTATLDATFDPVTHVLDQMALGQDCHAQFFDGKPWDIPGVVIPDLTKPHWIGTYKAVGSSLKVVVTLEGDDLMLQLGAFKRRLVATEKSDQFVWTLGWEAKSFHVVMVLSSFQIFYVTVGYQYHEKYIEFDRMG
ncbi:Aste57867_24078 [Aphanomyces stellatus]|uniref:Aste57867_24078 protein n=1 Tax=Aphanomyces stellatus TaxID=120398 RepID=A0A485LQ77_9STRA|nr:hypothetical protein As57867_024005 [Aphanomyces stellatus]VFU00720.1 Aste57867_24078 [Aphanomyces stellatus]